MEMVENALPGPGAIYSERFGTPVPATPPVSADPIAGGAAVVSPEIGPSGTHTSVSAATPATAAPPPQGETGTVTILLNRKKKTVPRRAGETLLESARRAGLVPPFSCEAGNCATCIAKVTSGHATLRVNEALTDDELDEGYVLTCQAVPDTDSITVDYE